ncbi:hypothetical protein B0H10DRAFT_2339210 [Mycena sp. CBHHK59/15]|nr:hypothetical protein B0H10DRAFT_2339210 [Mycena sp. CBHHK59/15]
MPAFTHLLALLSAFGVITTHAATDLDKKVDPCAIIGGKKWVAPSEVRACVSSFKVDPTVKSNILDVVRKTLAFHTSVNYQITAPEPFSQFVHEDLLKDLARISKSEYASDYDLHIDLSRTLKRLNDGLCLGQRMLPLFLNFLPLPLALLTQEDGSQNVHIVPEAFQVASAEFTDEISLSGAKVLLINGRPPFEAVNADALITGTFQALGTRQHSFFSSYAYSTTNFAYSMGDFAQQSLPLDDSVDLVIQRVNQTKPDKITIPYRSRINPDTVSINSSATYRANNCVAVDGTNGVDLHTLSVGSSTADKFRQAPVPSSSKHRVNAILDTAPLSDLALPPGLQPSAPTLNGSFGGGAFYLQKDGKTGVLALTNNGGGFICVGDIIGPTGTTVPQAGLDTKARDGPLARRIVQQLVENNQDPVNQNLLYNPLNWNDANGVQFAATGSRFRLLHAFSQRLGHKCQPRGLPSGFDFTPPDFALFKASKVVIVSNGCQRIKLLSTSSRHKRFCAVCNKYINLGDGGDKNFVIHENGAAHRAKLPATARAPGDTKPLTSFFALKPRVPAASSSGNPPTASSSTKTAVPALPRTSAYALGGKIPILADQPIFVRTDFGRMSAIFPNPVESDPRRVLLTRLRTAISTLPTTTPVAFDNDLLATFSVNPTTLIAPSQDPWEDVLHGLIDSFTYEGGKPRSTIQLSTLIRRGDLGMNGFAKWIEACFFELNIPLGALEMRVERDLPMIQCLGPGAGLNTTGAALGYKKPSLRMLSKSGSAMRIAR